MPCKHCHKPKKETMPQIGEFYRKKAPSMFGGDIYVVAPMKEAYGKELALRNLSTPGWWSTTGSIWGLCGRDGFEKVEVELRVKT